jgi:putative glycosyltransferase
MSANFITPFDFVNAAPRSLSIVSTLYCSERFVVEFIRRVSAVAAKCCENYEIILVDDGSPDGSLRKALEIQAQTPRLSVVEFSRNFGHHKALVAGLAQAKGDAVFLIDSDLEEPPELLGDLWNLMIGRPSVDVVYAVQAGRRKGSFAERTLGSIFYRLFHWLCPIKYDANQLTARLMRKAYVQEVLRYAEREFDLWGLFSLTGFNQQAFPAIKGSKGFSTYTLRRKMAVAYDMITSFSARPLVLIFLLGLTTTAFALLMVIFLVAFRLLVADVPIGWASIALSIWFLGGLILMSLGVIGLYLSKVFLEVKGRPRFHIRRVCQPDFAIAETE